MSKSKFNFIELPRPEIELAPDGSAQILGGVVCSIQYTQCSGSKSSLCDTGSQGNAYNPEMPCGSNSSGCGGGMLCSEYSHTCKAYAS